MLTKMQREGRAGCDLPGGWEGSTHPFVLFDPVLEHYDWFLHACIYMLDPPTFFGTNHTLSRHLLNEGYHEIGSELPMTAYSPGTGCLSNARCGIQLLLGSLPMLLTLHNSRIINCRLSFLMTKTHSFVSFSGIHDSPTTSPDGA